ncbi:MAG: site-specific DNA-methyltransferase [Methanobrevibacter sp.]|jgi:DNA modification methylase|nr:site-specific DNA-methyltransferase [Candidatus Methanoflexus mossambicus]
MNNIIKNYEYPLISNIDESQLIPIAEEGVNYSSLQINENNSCFTYNEEKNKIKTNKLNNIKIKNKKSNQTKLFKQTNDINILNIDCFEFFKNIEKNSIDLILIDPPYEISRETGFQKGEETGRDTDRFRVSYDFGKWDYSGENDLQKVIFECYRVLKKSGTLICFYDLWKITELKNYFENAKFKQLRFCEWIKTNPVPINSKLNYLTNAREIFITGVKISKPTFNSEYDKGVYEYPIYSGKDRFHPTQKSLELCKELILKHSNEDDYVLDCFSGSGTTAVASFLTNRNFMGCEINKEYFDKSIKRLDEYD